MSQAATNLKACQIAQDQQGQCDNLQRGLDQLQQRCIEEGFTRQDRNGAIDHGFAQLQGDATQSPYARQVQKQRWENSLMRPNVERFKKQFPSYEQYMSDVMDDFNTSACPSQYQGGHERWLFVAQKTLKRYPLSLEEGSQPRAYVAYLMAKQMKGRCYSPNPEKQTYKIANIPQAMLVEMEAKSDIRLLKCQHPSCMDDLQALEHLYDRYQKQYREYRQLALCADIDIRNSERRTIKGKKRSPVKMPDHCPKEEVHVKMLNAKGNLEQLTHHLFQDVTIRVQTVKMEQK